MIVMLNLSPISRALCVDTVDTLNYYGFIFRMVAMLYGCNVAIL